MKNASKAVMGLLIALVASVALLGGTAGAHVLEVENRGNGDVRMQWVGGGGASHGTGLIVACEAHKAQGKAAATIDTPWNPGSCTHG